MADLRYQVQVDTRGATQSLQNLQGRIGSLQSAFGGLKTALGAVAFGAAIRGAVGFAAAVNDMSSATNVSRQSILGLGQALTTNGGQASKATDAVQRFSLTMGQAAEGSRSAQDAFAKIGISLQDLGTLDESELLARTIEGLGAIEDSGRRAAIQTQIFGKTMAGVNAAGLAGDFRRLAEEQQRNAEAVRKAGEAQDKLNAAMNKFQLAVIRTIEPMVDAFNRISDENLELLIDAFVKIGASLATLVVVTKTIQGLTAGLTLLGTVAGATWAFFKSGIAGVVAAWLGFGKATLTATNLVKNIAELMSVRFTSIGGIVGRLVTVFSAIPAILAGFGKALIPFLIPLGKIALVAAGLVLVFQGIRMAITWAFGIDPVAAFISSVKEAYQRLREFIGLSRSDTNTAMAVDPAIQNAVKQQRELAKQREIINQALDKERENVNAVTRAYREQSAEFNQKFAFQTRLLRLTDEQRLVEETMADAQRVYLSQIEPLLRRIQEIKASGNAADLQILPVLKQGIADITAEYKAQLPALQQLINARLEEMAIQKEQVRLEELATQAAERRIAVEESVRDIIINGQKKIQAAYDDLAVQGLSGIDRALKQIEIEERRVAEAARERVAAQFGDNDPDGLVRAMDEISRASAEIVRRRQAATRAIMQEQRTFAAGWRRAWAEYRDAARDSSRLAESIFKTATQGMEDAIVNFAKTGKFEWKGMVADMAEQLLRSQIQKTIASIGDALGIGNLFGGKGSASTRGQTASNPLYVLDVASGGAGGAGAASGGNLLGSLGSIFGGSTPGGTPGINPNAGGSGGSILGTIGSVLGTIGSGLGTAVKTVTSSIGNVVSGLVSGVKNLFGGFFANGGTIPRGRFGVVGERGPELIRGPADITPMSGLGGGVTNVTYNISAVDAISFQQLVARDPGFIHAVAMQGARSQPIGRR